MAEQETKRGPKKLARGNDEIAQRIAENIDKEFSKLARDLPKYYEVLKTAAINKDGKYSNTNQISSAKCLIDMADKFLKNYTEEQEKAEKEKGKGDPAPEKPEEEDDSPIIQFPQAK